MFLENALPIFLLMWVTLVAAKTVPRTISWSFPHKIGVMFPALHWAVKKNYKLHLKKWEAGLKNLLVKAPECDKNSFY